MARILLWIFIATLSTSSLAGAQERSTRLTLRDLGTVVPRLESNNPDEVREAVDQLTEIDHPDVIPPLAALLRSGQPDAITDRVLIALKQLAHPSAIDVLVQFTSHRRAGARRRAYQALAAIEDARIPALLEQGLRDSDRSVRAAAALALGNIGASGSLDLLFRAFERGVIEAAISIGKLGRAEDLARYHEHLGNKPLSVMLSGYEEFLARTDIRDETKTDIIARLGEVSGPMVRRFFEQYLAQLPSGRRTPLRNTVEETLRRIPEQ